MSSMVVLMNLDQRARLVLTAQWRSSNHSPSNKNCTTLRRSKEQKASVGAREAHRGPNKACLNKCSTCRITSESDASVRDTVARSVRQSQAPSRSFHRVLTDEDIRAAGKTSESLPALDS